MAAAAAAAAAGAWYVSARKRNRAVWFTALKSPFPSCPDGDVYPAWAALEHSPIEHREDPRKENTVSFPGKKHGRIFVKRWRLRGPALAPIIAAVELWLPLDTRRASSGGRLTSNTRLDPASCLFIYHGLRNSAWSVQLASLEASSSVKL